MVSSVQLSREIMKSNRLMKSKMNEMFSEFIRRVSSIVPDFQEKFQEELMKQPMDAVDALDLFVGKSSLEVQRIYYEILAEYGYHMKDKVLTAIDLVSSRNFRFSNFEKVQNIPGISAVEVFHYPFFTIKTLDQTYYFLPIGEIYEEDVEEIQLRHQKLEPGFSNLYSTKNGYQPFALGNLSYACHFATEHFSYLHPELYAVTALVPHMFEGCYWFHSYNETHDGTYVLDVSNGFIMGREEYEGLLEPMVLDKTLGADIATKKESILKNANLYMKDCILDNVLKGFAYYEFDQMSTEEQMQIRKKIRF